MNFMKPYDFQMHVSRNKIAMNNKEIDIYNSDGQPLNHRLVMEHTVYVPPGRRCLVNARVAGKHDINGQTVMAEGSKLLFETTGVMVARVLGIPKNDFMPIEFHNTTEETQRICKDQTVGVLHSVIDAELWDDVSTSQHANATRTKKTPNYAADAVQYIHKLFVTEDEAIAPPRAADDTTWTCKKALAALGDDIPEEYTTSDRLPKHVREVFDKYGPELESEDEKAAFNLLLEEFQHTFATDKYDLGQATLVKHHIDTGDESAVKQKVRRLPQAHYPEIEKQVLKLAESGVIQPSSSNYGSNVLLVKKKDGTWRMCVDYRELNRKTKNKDLYLLPRIDDTLDALSGARFFCTLDLLQGYHQVQLTEECRHKTAFLTPHMVPSLWEYTCMPFGITGGPSTFQRLMDLLLQGLEYRIALAYLDDVIVFGSCPFEAMDRLALIFHRLRRANLKLKPSKCTFFETETNFLGHVVSAEGVRCDPNKVKAVTEWKRPSTNREALQFAAFVCYYHRFVPGFSELSKPLYELGRKRTYEWTDEHEESFQKLRTAIITAPVMSYPQAEGEWILDTDASGFAIGAALSQMQPNEDGELEERAIAFGSKALEPRQQRYCTRRRELLAIVHFVKVFRAYLYGRHVTIRTDHASLKYIKTMNNPDDQFARWIEILEETYYTIEIRKGSLHCNADALSRLPSENCDGKRCICPGVDELEKQELATLGVIEDNWKMLSPLSDKAHAVCNAVMVDSPPDPVQPTAAVNAFSFMAKWTAEDIATDQQNDPDTRLLYEYKALGNDKPSANDISGENEAAKGYFHDWRRIILMPNGVLYRQWESVEGNTVHNQMLLPGKYRETIFHHLHTALDAAHMGRRRTMNKMHKKYHWHRMGEDIGLWIDLCRTCQQRKIISRPQRAPLQTHTPGERNEKVAIDLMGPFNLSARGNLYIAVIIDHFTKYARAVALPNKRAQTVAEALMSSWISYFGPPRQLHSDQGKEVDSTLMHELCEQLQIEKTRTSGYHPAGDGQVERQNRTVLNIMHSYAADDPENWDKHLDVALMGYNSTKHSITGYEPNRLQLGRQRENGHRPDDA